MPDALPIKDSPAGEHQVSSISSSPLDGRRLQPGIGKHGLSGDASLRSKAVLRSCMDGCDLRGRSRWQCCRSGHELMPWTGDDGV